MKIISTYDKAPRLFLIHHRHDPKHAIEYDQYQMQAQQHEEYTTLLFPLQSFELV